MPGAGTNVGLLGEAQDLRMTRGDLQQLVDTVAGGVVFITCQLQAYAGDFDRNQVVVG